MRRILVIIALFVAHNATAATGRQSPQVVVALSDVPHYERLFTPTAPPVIAPPRYTISDNTDHSATDKHEQSKTVWERFVTIVDRTFDDPVAFFTLVLAISTIGLWVVTWRSGVRNSTDMQRSVRVAERALESVERAFVFVRGFAQIAETGHDGRVRQWAIMPVIYNSGSTPSRNMLLHGNIDVRYDELPDDFDFPDKWEEGKPREHIPTFIGPHADIWMIPLGAYVVDLSKVNSGVKKIYLWGWIDYNDTFPNTERHRTEFCHQIVRVGDINNPVGNPLVIQAYKRHNGADSECYRQPAPYVLPTPQAPQGR
jgi:hypothetical protein